MLHNRTWGLLRGTNTNPTPQKPQTQPTNQPIKEYLVKARHVRVSLPEYTKNKLLTKFEKKMILVIEKVVSVLQFLLVSHKNYEYNTEQK